MVDSESSAEATELNAVCTELYVVGIRSHAVELNAVSS